MKTYKATAKAKSKFWRDSFAFNVSKLNSSGKYRWIIAQNAKPSDQEDEKFRIFTPWNIKYWYKKNKQRDLIDLLYKIVLDLDTNVKLYL